MSEQTAVMSEIARLHIGGEWLEASGGKTFETWNPATGEVLARVAEASDEDVDRAVSAARTALDSRSWAAISGRERGRILYRIADLIERDADRLARLETLDNGKPLREARAVDLRHTIECFRYYAGWADKIEGEVLPVPGPYLNYTRREPVGVCAAIVPWNFPLQTAAWKVAPALACGNTVILKPAEQTPLTALELARIAAEAGLPPGVLNVLPGYGETTGAALVRHPGVDKIAFTGSTPVGREIQRESATSLKRVSLELGGKSANVVLADADLEAAAKAAANAIFFNAGQVCTAGSRLLVDRSIHEEFVGRVIDHARAFVPGDPLLPETRMGPLVSREQLDRVTSYIEAGRREGASIVHGGDRPDLGNGGYFVNPTIFDDVEPEMTIAKEEIFGPVLSVIEFDGIDEAIDLANRSVYGLAAAVWTRDVARAHRVAHALKAGTVWVNMYLTSDSGSPFGGYKQSGFGRELGRHALDLYTQVKSVWVHMK